MLLCGMLSVNILGCHIYMHSLRQAAEACHEACITARAVCYNNTPCHSSSMLLSGHGFGHCEALHSVQSQGRCVTLMSALCTAGVAFTTNQQHGPDRHRTSTVQGASLVHAPMIKCLRQMFLQLCTVMSNTALFCSGHVCCRAALPV